MQDTEVYIKTDAGRDEIRSRTIGLPMSIRAILLMVDGQRPVSAMRPLIAGSKAPADVLDALVAQGLIEPRNGVASAPAAVAPPHVTPIAPAAPVSPTPMQAAAPVAASKEFPVAPTPAVRPDSSIAAAAVTRYDGPLDLVLPTIHGPEAAMVAEPVVTHRARVEPVIEQVAVEPVAVEPVVPPVMQPLPQPVADGPAPLDRYEQLYTMMNEIVRDFLAPHRRYFFQLKIERCGTPDDLLELLHDLQTALAKARGEAFASDVIARLRNAAA